MECHVPPKELEVFQKLWNEGAPRRCHENNCELPADTPLGQLFCKEHADAGRKVVWGLVVERKVVPKSTHESRDTKVDANPYESPDGEVDRRCGRVEMVAGCRVCTKCGRGAEVAKTCARNLDRTAETQLDKTLKRNAESLQIANNVWFFRTEAEPDHIPAWTKKRRL